MSSPLRLDIAIADDHAILRSGLARVLNDYEELKVVAQASHGGELISMIEALEEKPHICILDVNMPVMNGYATAAALKAKWPKMGILALSMFDSEYNIIRMLRSGASGYMLKDASPDDLHKALLEIGRTGYYESPIMSGQRLQQIIQSGYASYYISERELMFLTLCCTDLSYREIGEKMSVSIHTVDNYRVSLFRKLQVSTRVGLAMFAIRAGLATPGVNIPETGTSLH